MRILLQVKYGREAMNVDRKTYTVPQIAKILGISGPKAYDLAHSEKFPAIFIGRRIVIPIDLFHRWIEQQAELKSR